MSNILGGFEGKAYKSTTEEGAKTNLGVVTRFNPLVDPGNIDVRGTGRRGLYNILLGIREPRFEMDLLVADESFLDDIIDGQTAISWLHLKVGAGGAGLSFEEAYANRITGSCRAGEAVNATVEFWSEGAQAYVSAGAIGADQTTPKRWSDSVVSLAGATITDWHEWRFEVNNNLQRLANVADGGTRAVKARHRDVSATLIRDLVNYTDYVNILNLASEQAIFNFTLSLEGTELINSNARYGPLASPAGGEDLITRQFPLEILDLT